MVLSWGLHSKNIMGKGTSWSSMRTQIWIPSTHIKKPAVHAGNTSNGGQRQILKACWPSLAQTVSFQVNERPCLQAIKWRAIEEDTNIFLWPLHVHTLLCMHHIHIYTHPTHTNITKHLAQSKCKYRRISERFYMLWCKELIRNRSQKKKEVRILNQVFQFEFGMLPLLSASWPQPWYPARVGSCQRFRRSDLARGNKSLGVCLWVYILPWPLPVFLLCFLFAMRWTVSAQCTTIIICPSVQSRTAMEWVLWNGPK